MRRSWVRIPQGAPEQNPWNLNGFEGFFLSDRFQILGRIMAEYGWLWVVVVAPVVAPKKQDFIDILGFARDLRSVNGRPSAKKAIWSLLIRLKAALMLLNYLHNAIVIAGVGVEQEPSALIPAAVVLCQLQRGDVGPNPSSLWRYRAALYTASSTLMKTLRSSQSLMQVNWCFRRVSLMVGRN